jgi:hypothetical protein
MYAIGAYGSSDDLPEKVKLNKKSFKPSPVHKRTRILFDDILANAVKKGGTGHFRKNKFYNNNKKNSL